MGSRTAAALVQALALCGPAIAARPPSADGPDPCPYFYRSLGVAPHAELALRFGRYTSVLDHREYRGCEVTFLSTGALLAGREAPSLAIEAGSDLYRRGWRQDDGPQADGDGTAVFRIDGPAARCVVLRQQGAGADAAGNDAVAITVQCSPRQDQ
jgi:hypothetical protein